jgi:hypothetical protein
MSASLEPLGDAVDELALHQNISILDSRTGPHRLAQFSGEALEFIAATLQTAHPGDRLATVALGLETHDELAPSSGISGAGIRLAGRWRCPGRSATTKSRERIVDQLPTQILDLDPLTLLRHGKILSHSAPSVDPGA